MIYSEFYDTDKIEKEWQRLKIPPEYHFFNLDEIFTNDISFYLSIRKDAGKTTNAIILGMILHKLYGVTCEYIRNDTEQTVFGVIGKLFDTIKDLNYIQRLFFFLEKMNNVIDIEFKYVFFKIVCFSILYYYQ